MRLGVISDTHGLLRPEVFDAFGAVDRIIHCGDVGDADILVALAAVAPVTAVHGNTDGLDLRGRIPHTVAVSIEDFDVVVTHGDELGSPTPPKLHAEYPQAEIILYGHTHAPLLELVDKTVTVMNPGSAGPRRFKLPVTVGILELEPGIPPRGRIVRLEA